MKICLLDTSYILELIKAPGFSTESNYELISKNVRRHIEENAVLFITIPCIIEVANHLADASDKSRAREVGLKFAEAIKSSAESKRPWTIIPTVEGVSHISQGLTNFVSNYLVSGIGLCDSFTIADANSLKAKYGPHGYLVHILTLDTGLKSYEPDSEI